MADFKTIIISDLHLGSPLARSKDLKKFLKGLEFDRLIINGDIFCDLNFSRLRKSDLHLLNLLRNLSKKKDVVWIEGNHDAGLIRLLSAFGIEVHEQYEFWWVGKCCVVVHGHQFDGAITEYPRISRFLSFLFVELQKVPGIKHWLPILMDKTAGKWQRLTPEVAKRALEFAKRKKYDLIFCGHTHERYADELDGIKYYNSGCWCGTINGYIEIAEGISLKHYRGEE